MSQSFLLETNDFIMKKKILSAREHYDFEDTAGNKLGEADGNLLQVPAKFVVKDTHGLELMHLQGKVFSLRREFTFYGSAGEELGTIKKKIAKLIGEEFWVEKNGVEFMRIYGDFTEHEYQLEVGGVPVASVHKKWVSVRDQLGVSITGDVDHRVIIGAVIVIEHVEVTERQSSSGSWNINL
ncbi:MAG: LURP-one-related family protein [Candidatus Bathyarchaeia archaeon]